MESVSKKFLSPPLRTKKCAGVFSSLMGLAIGVFSNLSIPLVLKKIVAGFFLRAFSDDLAHVAQLWFDLDDQPGFLPYPRPSNPTIEQHMTVILGTKVLTISLNSRIAIFLTKNRAS